MQVASAAPARQLLRFILRVVCSRGAPLNMCCGIGVCCALVAAGTVAVTAEV
jgi:hypothetical protein